MLVIENPECRVIKALCIRVHTPSMSCYKDSQLLLTPIEHEREVNCIDYCVNAGSLSNRALFSL